MPLTPKGKKIEENMTDRYGPEKGEEVFYASKNKGTIKGVDSGSKDCLTEQGNPEPVKPRAKDAASTSPAPPAPVRPSSRAADSQPGAVTSPNSGVPVWPGRVL